LHQRIACLAVRFESDPLLRSPGRSLSTAHIEA